MLEERTQPVVARPAPATGGGGSRSGLAAKHIRVNVPVRTVQSALRNAGFTPGPIDGKVGERTVAAIRAFQGAQGLTVDGVVGSRTWARLRNYSGAEK
jgi:peptidoglycan hydrolase-like protein with peptidoglycan-binding domain